MPAGVKIHLDSHMHTQAHTRFYVSTTLCLNLIVVWVGRKMKDDHAER